MRYVRDRVAPASREHVRKRREANRASLAQAHAPGARFWDAFEWLRAAAVYAERRSYRSRETRDRALARREQILNEASALLQDCADRIDAFTPPQPRRRLRRIEFRSAHRNAATVPDRVNAARSWLMFTDAQARRAGEELLARADAIKEEATARLAEWAEEMDADDYGE